MSLFRQSNYGPVCVESFSHIELLEDAIAEIRPTLEPDLRRWLDKVSFSVARVNVGNTVIPFAGIHHTLMLYSASLLKMTLLLASFELRELARNTAFELGESSAENLHQHIGEALRSELENRSTGITQTQARKVDLSSILQIIPLQSDLPDIDFTETFHDELRSVFFSQKNQPATSCIRKLGLAYISAALSNGGFFNPSTKHGTWLGGDYATGGFQGHPVPTADGLTSSQATTSESMMRFMASIASEQLVNRAASKEMKDLMTDVSFLSGFSRDDVEMSYVVSHAKVGVGTSKKPQLSESGIARTVEEETFVYCWQNCNKALPLLAVYEVLDIVFSNWP